MSSELIAGRTAQVPQSGHDVGTRLPNGTISVDASQPWRCDSGAWSWKVLEGRVDLFWVEHNGRGRRIPVRSFMAGEILSSLPEPVSDGHTIAVAIPGTTLEPKEYLPPVGLRESITVIAQSHLSSESLRIDALGGRDADLLTQAQADLERIRSGKRVAVSDPFEEAVRLLCAEEGVTLLPGEVRGQLGLLAATQSKLGTTTARGRAVTLEGRWWTRDGDAFLARKSNGDIVVVVPLKNRITLGKHNAHNYVAIDPATGTEQLVNEHIAQEIDSEVVVIHRVMSAQIQNMRSLLGTTRRTWRKEFIWTTLLALGASLMGLLVPIVLGKIIGVAVPNRSSQALLTLVLIMFSAAFGLFIFELTRNFTLLRLGGEVDRNLLPAVWDRVLRLPTSFFRQYEVGDLTTRIMGIDQARQLVGDLIIVTGLSAVFAVVNLVLVATAVPQLILPALAVIGVFLIICAFALRSAQFFNRTTAQAQGQRDALALQLVNGIAKIRVAGATATMFRRWAEIMSFGQRQQLQASQRNDITSVAAASLGLSASLVVYFTAMLNGDSINIAAFAVFASALGMATGAAGSIVIVVSQLGRARVLVDRAEPVLTTPTEQTQNGAEITLDGQVTFTDMHFRYSPETPLVLDGFSLTVPAGSFTAIVGASGCGKSTVLRCLLGFEQLESGSVSLDGFPLTELDLGNVRRQFGVVMQKFSLFGGTIQDNIIGGRDLTPDDAWIAAEQVGLAGFIRSLPMTMHTMLMDGGGTLSGGQIQRLLLARAVAGNPKVIILDEATSALDNPTQQIVTDSLSSMSATRIVVAHRLSTIHRADQIAVVDAGRVVELGTHEELLSLSGKYSELVKRQI